MVLVTCAAAGDWIEWIEVCGLYCRQRPRLVPMLIRLPLMVRDKEATFAMILMIAD